MRIHFYGLLLLLCLPISVKAEELDLSNWTLFFTSRTANQCIIFETQKGTTGNYTLHYKQFEGRGGASGEQSGQYKVYRDEKNRLIIKLETHRICLGELKTIVEKAKLEGNMFDQDGNSMSPGSTGEKVKLGDDVIDGVTFRLLKGKHADPSVAETLE